MKQLMPDNTRLVLQAERFARYRQRAAGFLRQQLPWFTPAALPDDRLNRAIAEAYALSHAAGLRAEADHLKYLYAAGYWGIGFATDPQYGAALAEAGCGADGPMPIEPALKALARWQAPIAGELAGELSGGQAIFHALLDLAEGPRPTPDGLAAGIAVIWPARARHLPGGVLAQVIAAAAAEFAAPQAALNGQAVHAVLALHLGCAFRRDPFLPWADKAASDGFELIRGFTEYLKMMGQVAA
ncbi:MAG: hypothetical protein Q4G26_04410 [Paracoccus sp. (in: a-proteobacteria)]|nr:hypothetical protein [Paracoccus sp. (in: a-proteobacteria)]